MLVGLNEERQITIANKTGNIFSIRICFADNFNLPRVVLWWGRALVGCPWLVNQRGRTCTEEEDLTSSWA